MRWEKVKLGDILYYEQPTNYIVESDLYDNSYQTPVLTAGKSFILGYTSEANGVYNNLPAIIFDDFTTVSKYVNFKFKVKSSAMKILTCDTKRAHLRFLYYLLQTINFNTEQHKRYWISTYANFEIQLPPLETQKRIADILDAADALSQKDQELLKKYDELAQAIFIDMFGDPVKNEKGWEKIKLKDVCNKIADIDHKMPVEDENGLPFISAKDLKDDGTISFENVKKISKTDFERLSKKIKPELNDIIYSRIGAKLGKARKVTNTNVFIVSYSCCTIKPNTELINTDFLCYYLDSSFCLNEVLKKVRSIGVPDLGMDEIRDLKIPYPSIRLQETFCNALRKIENSKEKSRNAFSKNLFDSLLQKAFTGDKV